MSITSAVRNGEASVIACGYCLVAGVILYVGQGFVRVPYVVKIRRAQSAIYHILYATREQLQETDASLS